MTDYEPAMISALQILRPKEQILCQFHTLKSLWGNAKRLHKDEHVLESYGLASQMVYARTEDTFNESLKEVCFPPSTIISYE